MWQPNDGLKQLGRLIRWLPSWSTSPMEARVTTHRYIYLYVWSVWGTNDTLEALFRAVNNKRLFQEAFELSSASRCCRLRIPADVSIYTTSMDVTR
jgi:hypothetical protein